jgi:hypothetical protein
MRGELQAGIADLPVGIRIAVGPAIVGPLTEAPTPAPSARRPTWPPGSKLKLQPARWYSVRRPTGDLASG